MEAQTVDAFVLEGPLDVPALERAFSELVRRHEILRTCYPQVAHRPRARVRPAEPVAIAVSDLSRGARWHREQAIRDALARLRAEPLDYRVEPPLRVRLLRVGDERHVLVVAVHEIVCDGESYRTLLRDLSRLYGSRADTDPPPLQYREAIHLGSHADAAAGDRHWERMYREAPLAMPLPFDAGGLTSATVTTSVDERATLKLSQDVVAGLGALATREAATAFMAYAAAYVLLLHRWTGERDVAIETSAANRARAELQDVVGMFARIMPLWVDVGDDPSFRTLLRRTRDVALTAFHYADRLPVTEPLWLLSGMPGLVGRPPYFRLREPAREPQLRLAGIAVRRFEDDDEPPRGRYCEVRVDTDATVVTIVSDVDGWAPGELRRMVRRFAELLAAAVAEPDRPIGALAPCRPAAGARTAAAQAEASVTRLEQLVERQARRDPLAVAVRAAGETLDYGTLVQRAQDLAERLRAAGAGPGRAVGIAPVPSPQSLVTALAALRTGATCVLGAAEEGLATPSGEPAAAEDVAFLLPTGGVTGPPRRIPLRHEQLLRQVAWQRAAFRLGPGDVALHSPGPGVRAWILSPWPYLAAGAQVVVPPAAGGMAGRPPADAPAEASRWLAAPPERPRLRLVRAQGPGALALPEASAPRRISLVREYCVSEAGGTLLAEPARGSTAAGAGVAAIPADVGVPVVVLDRCGGMAADGAIGELALGDGPAAVRTGDLGRERGDGSVEFLGRIADEVRFRGMRLNPTMRLVEQALASHPVIAAATVVWLPERAELVALAVSRHGELPAAHDLDRWIRDHEPDWVLPARYVAVEAIPLRADGTPDRAALAAQAQVPGELRTRPVTATERTLLKLWRKVLGRRRIGVHDNFFALGGTLVLGTDLARRAEEAGIGFTPSLLLVMPTIASLGAIIDGEIRRMAAGSHAPAATRRAR